MIAQFINTDAVILEDEKTNTYIDNNEDEQDFIR